MAEIKPERRNLGMLSGAGGQEMRWRILAGAAIALAFQAVSAQEGHPLSGTWTGDWGRTPAQRTHLTVVMSWDGKAVTGLVNPGPDAIPLSRVVVDWAQWTVRIEAEGVRAEGQLEDIGSSRRRIVGTWTQAGTTGDVRLTRE